MGNKKPPILTIPPTEPTIFRLPDRSSELLTLMARCHTTRTRRSVDPQKCELSDFGWKSVIGYGHSHCILGSCVMSDPTCTHWIYGFIVQHYLAQDILVSNVTSHRSGFDYPLTTALWTDEFQPCKDYGNHTVSSS